VSGCPTSRSRSRRGSSASSPGCRTGWRRRTAGSRTWTSIRGCARDGHGAYEPLDPTLLPPLFVAHLSRAAEPSEILHSDLRRRFDAGEPEIVGAMSRLAELADAARGALLDGDAEALGRAMDASFDVRRSIAALDARHVRMVELARSLGAPANYAGSGGAIVGLLRDGAELERLAPAFRAEGCGIDVCRPAAPTG
jgi:glucuronokinase